jgi:hypothetical protein
VLRVDDALHVVEIAVKKEHRIIAHIAGDSLVGVLARGSLICGYSLFFPEGWQASVMTSSSIFGAHLV